MRDTSRLRLRLAQLACLPVLAGVAACDSPDQSQGAAPSPSRAGAAAPAPTGAVASPPHKEHHEPGEHHEPHVHDHHGDREGIAASELPRTRLSPIAGDPPHVDGYDPEEEHCPSGNWCGSMADAKAIAAPGAKDEIDMGCVANIHGHEDGSPLSGPAYEGLSAAPRMEGAFNRGLTATTRAEGQPDACCYHWFEHCSGRPLLDGNRSVVASTRPGSQWVHTAVTPDVSGLPPQVRELLAQAWLDDALREHASVASFSRAALELMSVGAPPELVEDCHRAALDEIGHARACFALASAYAGRMVSAGPLASPALRAPDLASLAIDTFVEGCLGETVATLVAERALGVVTDDAVRASLNIIAQDEARHAALAWRTVAWALSQGDPSLEAALSQLLAHPPVVDTTEVVARAPEVEALCATHGRLPAADLERAVHDAWHDIIAPSLAALLGRVEPRPREMVGQA